MTATTVSTSVNSILAGAAPARALAYYFPTEPPVAEEGPISNSSGAPVRLADERDRRDRVVLENLPLVTAIARRVLSRLPVTLELDDLVQAGTLGLFAAAERYDSARDVKFQAYAKHRIKGAILDYLRQLDWASREVRRRVREVQVATEELTSQLQRRPTEVETAEKVSMSVEQLRSVIVESQGGPVSLNMKAPESDDHWEYDFPDGPESQPDFLCGSTLLRGRLERAMKSLSARSQRVLELRYSQEKTMKEIGAIFGVNESRISQIHKRALKDVADLLRADGIDSSRVV